jgi:hypothetical protein
MEIGRMKVVSAVTLRRPDQRKELWVGGNFSPQTCNTPFTAENLVKRKERTKGEREREKKKRDVEFFFSLYFPSLSAVLPNSPLQFTV